MDSREFDPLHLDTLLTIEEVEALLNIPTFWIYERTRQGTIPQLKLAKIALIGPYDIGTHAMQRSAL